MKNKLITICIIVLIITSGYSKQDESKTTADIDEQTTEITTAKKEVDEAKTKDTKEIKDSISTDVKNIDGVFYSIQVGVYSKQVSARQLNNVTPLNSEIISGGLIRYTSGVYKTLSEANAAKDRIRGLGISDAFVVAYNGGTKITVAEARAKELANELAAAKKAAAEKEADELAAKKITDEKVTAAKKAAAERAVAERLAAELAAKKAVEELVAAEEAAKAAKIAELNKAAAEAAATELVAQQSVICQRKYADSQEKYRAGQYVETVAILEEMLQMDGCDEELSSKAQYYIGYNYANDQFKLEQARKAYQKVVDIYPAGLKYVEYSKLKLASYLTSDEAEAAYKAGNFTEAVALREKVVQQKKCDNELAAKNQYLAGYIYQIKLDDLVKTKAAYNKVITLHPKSEYATKAQNKLAGL